MLCFVSFAASSDGRQHLFTPFLTRATSVVKQYRSVAGSKTMNDSNSAATVATLAKALGVLINGYGEVVAEHMTWRRNHEDTFQGSKDAQQSDAQSSASFFSKSWLISFQELLKSWVVINWHGVAFGSYGEVLQEGVPLWVKDVAFGDLLADSIERHVHWVQSEVGRIGVGEDLRGYAPKHHEVEGMFQSLEALKRTTFGTWVLDKGLARGLLKEVLMTTTLTSNNAPTIGDFGAGGGHYSSWLNETGLVSSYAYDGTPGITSITGGTVHALNLAVPTDLGRVFDWVLCIEVAEHVPEQFSQVLIENWARHARIGLIISWSDSIVGIGHVNPQPFQIVNTMIERLTGFVIDVQATEKLRAISEKDYISKSVAVYRRVL